MSLSDRLFLVASLIFCVSINIDAQCVDQPAKAESTDKKTCGCAKEKPHSKADEQKPKDTENAPCDKNRRLGKDDERCATEVEIYVGSVVDSFAAAELNQYINPNVSGDIKSSFVAGVDVERHLLSTPGGRSLWLYMETVHGIHTTDVDCKATPTVAVCKENPPTNDRFLYILKNARTLEALAGLRLELPMADPDLFWYFKSQVGFLDVAGSGKDIIDNHVYGAIGVGVQSGHWRNSYFDVGLGKTDLFDKNPNRRAKFDGYLTAPLPGVTRTSWFLQMVVDSDFRKGADSIQIYYGLSISAQGFEIKF